MTGYDCSHYVCEILMASGVLPHNSYLTAQGLFDKFSQDGKYGTVGAGALAFFGKDAKSVSHVGFCLDDRLMLNAAGGDSQTVSDAAASKQNAFVKMRPIKYRKDFLAVIKPNYPGLI